MGLSDECDCACTVVDCSLAGGLITRCAARRACSYFVNNETNILVSNSVTNAKDSNTRIFINYDIYILRFEN